MRKYSTYAHLLPNWPNLFWDGVVVSEALVQVRYSQGKLMGKMEGLGFTVNSETALNTVLQDVLKSSAIEGERLPIEQVRSSIARKLGIEHAGVLVTDKRVDGVVKMTLNAAQEHHLPLTKKRLCAWHKGLFESVKVHLPMMTIGEYRLEAGGPMQVVSGPMGRERVHFEAPSTNRVPKEMTAFLKWFNSQDKMDDILKAGLAHLWFLTIHPFDDGNGRIARALTDMLLSRSDGNVQRFYSLSTQLHDDKKNYYKILERTQKGGLDVTEWMIWFLSKLEQSIAHASKSVNSVLDKSRFWNEHQNKPLNERQHNTLNKLLEGNFRGNLTTTKWAKMNKCSADTALRDVQKLMEFGMLNKESGGGRSTNYVLTLN